MLAAPDPSSRAPALPAPGRRAEPPAEGGAFAWQLLEITLFHAYLALLAWSFGPFLHVPLEPLPFLLAALPVALAAWALARWRWLSPTLAVAAVVALGLAARYDPLLWWRLRLGLVQVIQLVAAAWSGHPEAVPPPVAYALMTLGGLAAGVVAHRERMSQGRGIWLLGLGAAVLLVQWLWYWDPAYDVLWPAMALGLAWLAAREAVAGADRAAGSGGGSGGAARPAPAYAATPARLLATGVLAGAALLLLVSALPSAIPPASLGSLGVRLARLLPSLGQLRGAGVPVGGLGLTGFDLSSTGFAQANDRLGGPVLLDPTPVLRLRLRGEPARGTLYLRGMAEDVYTGDGWRLSQTEEPVLSEPPAPAGAIPPSAPLLRLQVEPQESLPVLFYPLQPVRLRAPAPLRADGMGNLYASGGALEGSYQLVVRLIAPGGPGYDLSPQAGPVPPPDQGTDLQLPATLPARVKRLAEQVTAGLGDPLARAQALEAFLKRTYPYTLDASAPPPGRDFTDFFLFDERQGYCTYYSTAMVVMLRTLGIPARWVTGFRVDLGSATPLPDGSRSLEVRNEDAHAWVEAWIPGRGWVPFDPTPGSGATGAQASVAPSAPDAPAPGRSAPPPQVRQPQEGQTGDAGPASGRAGRGSPAVLALGAALLLALLWAGRGWWREAAPAAGSREQVGRLFRLAERLGRHYGLPRQQGETPGEYARRVGRVYPSLVPPLSRLAALYERALFAPAAPAAAESAEARRAWEELNRAWAGLAGRWRHAWHRWLAW